MTDILLIVVVVLMVALFLLHLLSMRRKVAIDLTPVQQAYDAVQKSNERTERLVREEIDKSRQEATSVAAQLRQELARMLKAVADTLSKQQLGVAQGSDQKLEGMRKTVESRLQLIQEESTKKLEQVRQDSLATAKAQREEIATNLRGFNEAIVASIGETGNLQKSQLGVFSERLDKVTQSSDQKADAMRETVEQRLAAMQDENGRKLDQMRLEATASTQKARDEVNSSVKTFSDSLSKTLGDMGNLQKSQLDVFSERLDKLTQSSDLKSNAMRDTIEQRLGAIQEDNGKKLDQMRLETTASAQKARDEVNASLKSFSDSLSKALADLSGNQRTQLGNVVEQIAKLTDTTEKKLDAQRTAVDDRLKQIQAETASNAKQLREEVGNTLKGFNDSVVKGMSGMSETQRSQMEAFSVQLGKLIESNEHKLEAVKNSVETKLQGIQEDNAKQLDQMRATVDEKLQGTLEKRLGESFTQVSERLEAVFKGLGEMQTLATGVGDLKRVLTNVKTRGTWGEVQLGAMLEQVLMPEQYGTNIATKDGGDRVEFAIKFPGRGEDKDEVVWLPIDAKFPVEDYQRLVEAQESADAEAAEVAGKQLEIRVKGCAKDICDKYINPPKTTDIAILFLPTEGLFAEVVRRIGLVDSIQRDCHVMIAGPTTLYSILNSFQMGFRTMSIEKRSSEVWNLLSAVKTEFSRYGDVLSKVQKKLEEASDTIDKEVAVRTRAINRKLRTVQELPSAEAKAVLLLETSSGEGEADEPQA